MKQELQNRGSLAGELLAKTTATQASAVGRFIDGYRWFVTLILFLGLAAAAHGQQYLYVDCSGSNPNDYPTISSALANVSGPGAYILVMGACTENVAVSNALNLSIGAWYGQTANLTGSITVSASQGVFLYGLNVTNSSGNGFTIETSRSVILQSCSSNSNQLLGLRAESLSDVSVVGPSSFDHNGTGGIYLDNNSILEINDWAGPTDISNNHGFFLQENAELSLWNCEQAYQSSVLNNGPVGISAGLGSQVTFYADAQISGHTGSGIEIYGNSQLRIQGNNLISANGTASDARSAGIVVDGNSEAYLRGGQITSNQGPGILALVNSSADFTGATFSSNSGGVINCDSSAYMVSDMATGLGNPAAGITCRTPHNLGNRRDGFVAPLIPDSSALKSKVAQYKKMAAGKPH